MTIARPSVTVPSTQDGRARRAQLSHAETVLVRRCRDWILPCHAAVLELRTEGQENATQISVNAIPKGKRDGC